MPEPSSFDHIRNTVFTELRNAAAHATGGMSVQPPDAIRNLVASGGGNAALVTDATLNIAALVCREQLFRPDGPLYCDLPDLVGKAVSNGQLAEGAIDVAVDVMTFVAATAGGWRPAIQPLLNRWHSSGWLPQVTWFSAVIALRWSADILHEPADLILERALNAYLPPQAL